MDNRIKELRKKHNLTIMELGKKVGISGQSISLYERGQHEPRYETWHKLADCLGTSVPYLQGFGGGTVKQNGCNYCDHKEQVNCLKYMNKELESKNAKLEGKLSAYRQMLAALFDILSKEHENKTRNATADFSGVKDKRH